MSHKKNLSEIFNLEMPEEPKKTEVVVTIPEEPGSSEQEEDFQLARTTMRRIIQKTDDTLDEVLELARSNEQSRTCEVAGQLIKTMSEVSRDLLELHKQKKDITGGPKEEAPRIGNQNVFVGTTQEILRALAGKPPRDEDDSIIIDNDVN